MNGVNNTNRLHSAVNAVDTLIPRRLKRLARRLAPGVVANLYVAIKKLSPEAPVEVIVQNGPLAGRRFHCSLRTERFYWAGNFEPAVQNVLKWYLRPGMVVYDIGAHKAFFTLIAAQLVGECGRVVGFEPAEATRHMALANLAVNPDLAPRVELLDFAISDHTGTDTLARRKPGSTIAALTRLDTSSRLGTTVRCTTVDDFARTGAAPDFIKMDIEGGERLAFKHMRWTLETFRPMVVVEVHDAQSAAQLDTLLSESRYVSRELGGLEPFGRTISWAGRNQYLAVPIEKAGTIEISAAAHGASA